MELDADELDLARYEWLTHQGTQALPGAPTRRSQAPRGAGLWRGPPLAEFTEPFAQLKRARLQEQRLTVLQARIEADLALGRHAELVGELEALVARQPLQRSCTSSSCSAVPLGRQAEALEAYRRVRQTLPRSWASIQAVLQLQAAILAQDRRLDWTPPPAEPTPTIGEPAPAPMVPADTAVALPAAGQLPEVWGCRCAIHFTGRTGM